MPTSEAVTWATASRHNLPAEVASFIGREREIAEVKRLFVQTRLITFTGTGGSGKTRLALRVAGQLVPSFADGVWLVQFASLADSALVPQAVATALGIRGTSGRSLLATLAAALASRRLLLVLDNCEHLIGACARLVETLLGACPHLRVLATSREPLRIPGEVTWRVPPLTLPDEPLPPAEPLAEIEAVALFLDRVRARRPDFALAADNAAHLVTICRRMDGLPLAIELAAAQVGALSPAQIADRLDDALRLLAGGSRTVPRQETLRATLDWSYALLGEAEQTLLGRLAVFAGTFDVDAAEGVCSGQEIERAQVLGPLSTLVEKSLVESQIQTPHARYRLLEPVRQYAWKRVTDQGETDGLQRRHSQHFLEVVESAEPKLMSGERGPSMGRLAREEDNLRAALSWSRQATEQADVEVGLRLAGALAFYWVFRGAVSEGLEWTEAILARGKDASPAVHARALYGAGELAWLAGQPTLGRERVEEAERIFRGLGDKRWLAYTLQSLPMTVDHPRAHDAVEESLRLFKETGDEWGYALAIGAADLFPLLRDGDPTGEAAALLDEGLACARAVKDGWLIAMRLNMLGDYERSQGEDDAATRHYEEALSLLRRQDLSGTVPSLLHNLGNLALRRGDTRSGRQLFRESLTLFRNQGDQRGIADCLIGLGAVAAAMKQPEGAAELFGAAEALRQMTGAIIWPSNVADYERGLAEASAQTDEATFAAAWQSGREMRVEQAVERVLGEEDTSGEAASSDLTPRELEVAVLVTQGLTNRQIGAALFITEGTARLHVKHILQKLGFSSRAQIAAWAVERGLTHAPESG